MITLWSRSLTSMSAFAAGALHGAKTPFTPMRSLPRKSAEHSVEKPSTRPELDAREEARVREC